MGVSKAGVLAVLGSSLASVLFFIFHGLLSAIQETPRTVGEQFTQRVRDHFGIVDVFQQRGGEVATEQYRSLLKTAKRRVWAIGITNRRFLQNHYRFLPDVLRRSKDMDIRVVFGDPGVVLTHDDGTRESLIAVQNSLERQPGQGTDWVQFVDSEIERLAQLPKKDDHTGSVIAYKVCSISFFTCFVIDDDVFFFPMLVRGDSVQDPTIRTLGDSVLGNCILGHLDAMFENSAHCRVAFSNAG
jgi:hypothetical protein